MAENTITNRIITKTYSLHERHVQFLRRTAALETADRGEYVSASKVLQEILDIIMEQEQHSTIGKDKRNGRGKGRSKPGGHDLSTHPLA